MLFLLLIGTLLIVIKCNFCMCSTVFYVAYGNVLLCGELSCISHLKKYSTMSMECT